MRGPGMRGAASEPQTHFLLNLMLRFSAFPKPRNVGRVLVASTGASRCTSSLSTLSTLSAPASWRLWQWRTSVESPGIGAFASFVPSNQSLHRSVLALVARASVRIGKSAPAALSKPCGLPGELNR
jgi:hypothetical protein